MQYNVKIKNENGRGTPTQVLINDKEFPVTALQFNLDMKNPNKMSIDVLVGKLNFDVNTNFTGHQVPILGGE